MNKGNNMAIIDPTTDVGKLRLRLGDWGDVEWLSDAVYEQTLADCGNNLRKSAGLLAQYILAILTRSTRSRLAQIESYDNQQFEQYRRFIIDTVSNPAIMNIAPIAFATGDTENMLINFQSLWNAGYTSDTVEDKMKLMASIYLDDIV